MSSESIEVHIESIAGEEREACRNQHLTKGVDEQVRRMLGT
jgi:hypothetical protein